MHQASRHASHTHAHSHITHKRCDALTHHTSHISAVTLSHITYYTSHITHHTSYIIHHTPHITHHTSHITHKHHAVLTHHTSHITHKRCAALTHHTHVWCRSHSSHKCRAAPPHPTHADKCRAARSLIEKVCSTAPARASLVRDLSALTDAYVELAAMPAPAAQQGSATPPMGFPASIRRKVGGVGWWVAGGWLVVGGWWLVDVP